MTVPAGYILDEASSYRAPTEAEKLIAQATTDPTPDLDGAADAVAQLLAAFRIDEGDHTADTPNRVAKAWSTMLAGYQEDPSVHLLKTFSAPNEPGPVIVSGIRLVSTCAHHLLPFTGHATVAYRAAPGQNVVGLSKLARVVNGYSRRLQVQERIGDQIAGALVDRLNPVWACVIITAAHQCMTIRGVGEPNAETTTRTIRGLVNESDMDIVAAAHRDSIRKA